MALIVGGTTIPTNGNYVKYGGTDLTQVDVVKDGTRITVWKKITNIDALLNPPPYTIYNGPDSVKSESKPSRPVSHNGDKYISTGKLDTKVSFQNNVIEFSAWSSNSNDDSDSSLSGNQWIGFDLDVTSFKKIKFTLTVGDRWCSSDTYVEFSFSVSVGSNIVKSGYKISALNTWSGSNSSNNDYTISGNNATVEVDISSYTGSKNVKIINDFYTWAHGNNGMCVKVTELKFLS